MKTDFQTPDEVRWHMVCARQAADGPAPFVYAVTTTGIYCRPDCPARRPKRAHVRFFDAPGEADAAGFRPCKRCRPGHVRHDTPHADAIARACDRIGQDETEPSLADLAHEAGLSPGHFQRLFKAQVGLSPKQYARALRKRRLREGLPGAETVTDAIYDAGYEASSRAYADMKDMGLAPETLRKGDAREAIHYTIASSSLGPVFVAATARGVCMIEFLDEADGLARLKAVFPLAGLRKDDEKLARHLDAVIALIDMPADTQAELALDIRGTAFQERVWQALRDIPPGQTLSYSDLAEKIGRPGAARAVAGACAANRLAVAVPCHRVVRADGSISGYKWGKTRKRSLLERETPPAPKPEQS